MTIKESLSSNIVGHWDFRKSSIADQSSNAASSTFVNNPVWQNSDKGRVLLFDGSSNYVESTEADTNVEGLNTGTLSIWFKSNDTGIQSLFSISNTAAASDFMQLAIGDTTGSYADESIAFAVVRSSSVPLSMLVRKGHDFYSDNQWHNVIISTGAGSNFMMIDGVVQSVTYAFGSSATNEFSNINNVNTLRIGARTLSSGSIYFNGAIREVIVFNTALSQQQASELYNESLQEGYINKIPAATVLPESPALIASPVLSLNMDTQGSTVYDVSGNGNDGTVADVADTEGVFGRALDFDGGGSSVLVSDATPIQNIWSGGGSISVWIKPRSDGGNNAGRLIDKLFRFYVHSESSGFLKLGFDIDFTGGAVSWQTSSAGIAIDAWNHIVITYDSGSVANDAIMYVNGQTVTVNDPTPSGTVLTDVGTDLYIGNRAAADRGFDGLIEQAQAWSGTKLTQAQVTQLYKQGQKKIDLNITGEDWQETVDLVIATINGVLPSTPFKFGDSAGRWNIIESSGQKYIQNGTVGIVYISSLQSFGTWEFEVKQGAVNDMVIGFAYQEKDLAYNAVGQNGYHVRLSSTGRFNLEKTTNGSVSTLAATASSTINTSTNYMIRVTRNTDGEFKIYTATVGSDYTLMTAALGANPKTDTSFTDSSYLLLDLDSSNEISNIKFWPTVRDPTA